MKQIISGIARSKTALAGLLVLAGTVATALVANAWGPNRATFTIENPADYITFNSITNSPYGDERNFVRIKEVNQPNSAYTNEIKLVAGKKYQVYTFFHNNAKAELNLVAKDTKVKVTIPNEIKAGNKAQIDSIISASNAQPKEVVDAVHVSTDVDVALRYVPNSAVLTTKKVSNVALPFHQMVADGTLIGTNGRDGLVPGCNEFSGYVFYQFEVVKPDFTVKKEARAKGSGNTWATELSVKADDIVEYRIEYANTGSIQQDNVTLKDALPKGLTYVAGSAEMKNAKTNGWEKLSAEAETYFKNTGLVKVGSFLPGGNVFIRYQLKVENADQMNCGYNSYTNIASAITENGTKQARAKVTAHKQCNNQPKQIQVCELNTKKVITINESAFDSKIHSKNLDDCKTSPTTPPQPPVPPKELPSTGLEVFGGIVGLVSLVASAGYYLNSRKLS